MQIEESLAAREIIKMLNLGFGETVAISAAEKLVLSQGFGLRHAAIVARKMFDLVA